MPNSEVKDYYKYYALPWGDLIYGSESHLKSLGLGINKEYPTTDKKSLSVHDPRGFKTNIKLSTYKGLGIYSASISFPGRERNFSSDIRHYFADGVTISYRGRSNTYRGSSEALSKANLIDVALLPGMPDMMKSTVTIYSDGTVRTNKHAKDLKKSIIGTKTIKRISRDTYEVSLQISDEEQTLRFAKYRSEDKDWERQMNALPRPKALNKEIGLEYIKTAHNKKHQKAKKDNKFQLFLDALIAKPSNKRS